MNLSMCRTPNPAAAKSRPPECHRNRFDRCDGRHRMVERHHNRERRHAVCRNLRGSGLARGTTIEGGGVQYVGYIISSGVAVPTTIESGGWETSPPRYKTSTPAKSGRER